MVDFRFHGLLKSTPQSVVWVWFGLQATGCGLGVRKPNHALWLAPGLAATTEFSQNFKPKLLAQFLEYDFEKLYMAS